MDPGAAAPTPGPAEAALPARRRRRVGLRAKLLFALVPTLAILGGTEAFCRVRETVREGRKRVRYSPRVPHAWLNMALEPGRRFEEPGRLALINDLGMRAPPPRDPKPPTRVVCVGGSSTYGLFVSANERTWPARVQAELARPDVEVLNAGCPAWDVRASQTNLELRLYDELRPDVVVACHVYNDVVANLDPLYDRASRVEWEPGERGQLRNWWHGHSALYRLLIAQFKSKREALANKATAVGEAGLAAYERNLRRLIERTRARGGKVLLCTEPTCYRPTEQESVDARVPSMEQWFHELSPFDYPTLMTALARYQETVRRVAAETGTPLCDLERLMPKDVRLFASPVHHTDEGEVLVGRSVAKALVDHGLVPPP